MSITKKVGDNEQAFIKANWFTLSSHAIAKHIGVSQRCVMLWGEKLGLPKKPRPTAQQSPNEVKAGEGNHVLSCPEMARSIFDNLTAKRETLLTEIAALRALPADNSGRVALRLQAVESELNKVEVMGLDFEELIADIEKVMGKPLSSIPTTSEDCNTLEELIDFLDTPEVREREGNLTGKVSVAADKITLNWYQLHRFATNELDPIFLSPEGVTMEGTDDE